MSSEENDAAESANDVTASAGVRIRFVTGSLDLGGTEKHLSMVLPRLAGLGYEPVVITLTHKGVLAETLEKAGIKVYQPHPWTRFLRRIPVLKMVLGPYSTLVYLILMYARTPASLTCLYLPAAYHLGWIAALLNWEANRTVMFRRSLNHYQKQRPLLSQLEKFLHKRQLAIVGNSKAVIQELISKEGVPEEKLTLIYNGIDVAKFGNREKREATRRTLGLGTDEIVLCIVANLIPYKGHTDLIDALINIRNKVQQPWRLLCVGCGIEQRPDLIEKVESGRLGSHVQWMGSRDDIPAILAAVDIGLLVSHQEGFSNSILEGMASGLPMIVTDVGGNSEAIEHQKSGVIVRPQDPQDLSAAILLLMNNMDLAKQYGIAARERVEKYFTIDICVDNYNLFFKNILQSD